MPLLRTFVFR